MSQDNQGSFSALSGEERNRIITEHLPMVRQIAMRFYGDGIMAIGIDLADLIQEGALALITSISRYDESYGTTFRTYAHWRVVGRVLDYIRRQQHGPRSALTRRRQFAAIHARYEQEHGRRATEDEIAKELSMSREQFARTVRSFAALEPMFSLDAPSAGAPRHAGENAVAGYIDYLPCQSRSVEQIVVEQDVKERVDAALNSLPPRAALVIDARYRREMQLKEVAEELKVTTGTAHKDTLRSVEKLRSALRSLVQDEHRTSLARSAMLQPDPAV